MNKKPSKALLTNHRGAFPLRVGRKFGRGLPLKCALPAAVTQRCVRRSVRCLFAILTGLAVTGCSDVVTTRFATLAEAKSKGAFERGWLPPLMPGSARSIVERNDLDLNTGTGSFDYDPAEMAAYVDSLSRAGAVSRIEQDGDVLTLSTNGSRWEIRLAKNSGQAQWNMRPL